MDEKVLQTLKSLIWHLHLFILRVQYVGNACAHIFELVFELVISSELLFAG